MKLPNIANIANTVAAWIFVPTVLLIAFYVVKAMQVNHFQLIIKDKDSQTVKNKFIDDFYLPNRHDTDMEFMESSFITKSIITYVKSLHFLKKAGIEYTVKRLTNKEYKSIAAA